jgi:hypothetical protein
MRQPRRTGPRRAGAASRSFHDDDRAQALPHHHTRPAVLPGPSIATMASDHDHEDEDDDLYGTVEPKTEPKDTKHDDGGTSGDEPMDEGADSGDDDDDSGDEDDDSESVSRPRA